MTPVACSRKEQKLNESNIKGFYFSFNFFFSSFVLHEVPLKSLFFLIKNGEDSNSKC